MTSRLFFILFLISVVSTSSGQQLYTSQSVLHTGTWFKVGTMSTGVYKVDVPFLNKLGITGAISSANIRLFANGGGMLPEDNSLPQQDDLKELAIKVVDGGDGIFNGDDYFLFYAGSADSWVKDSLQKTFHHQKHLYADKSYYFINIGAAGRRVPVTDVSRGGGETVTTYDLRFFHEVDTINFLKSGKNWYGEEFSNTPGNNVAKKFSLNIPGNLVNNEVTLNTSVVARSIGAASRFDGAVNGVSLSPIRLDPVSGNFLEAFASEAEQLSTIRINNPVGDSVVVTYQFTPGSFNAQGWLNWFEINARAILDMRSVSQLLFRDWSSVNTGSIARFVIQNASAATTVWDITDPFSVVEIKGEQTGNDYVFSNDATRLREYVAFNQNAGLICSPEGRVANQNLHNASPADMLVITTVELSGEAQRLAIFHEQKDQLKVQIATTSQIYNEFSGGSPDPTALRNYVKMFYDRAKADTAQRPKYLLLFGDASFDYKNRVRSNTNVVPAYESTNSLEPLSTYTSDDFFGFLDDSDDINKNLETVLLDIAIGRIPAATAAQAKTIVDKIIHYHSTAALGPWRTQATFVADDEDANLHLHDAESITATVSSANPTLNQNKIYLDAFRQQSGAGGSRYPAANLAIVNQMNAGNLIWNYSGHGGSQRLADEAIFDRDLLNQFTNNDKLPLLITATCDFAPFDDPTIFSLGEELLTLGNKGAIALTTTTRPVFANSNRVINNNFLNALLQPKVNGEYLTLGEALKVSKNKTYQSGDILNNRKFTLLGDPAVKLALPKWKIDITNINGRGINGNDTLKALNKYEIKGQVNDDQGAVINDFSGQIYLSVYGAPQTLQTLANDAGSFVETFDQQLNALYKGKATVEAGLFTFSFIVPKDVTYKDVNGKMSLYAQNSTSDATGVFTGYKMGDPGSDAIVDNMGPALQPYLNDNRFVNGGLVNASPILIVELNDSSGINTAGVAIGHDITGVLDGDDKNTLVLNTFYEADLDSYKKGTVRYQLPELSDGPHTLKIKAWDVANNSSEKTLDFVVASQKDLKLSHVFNYPNPFTTKTNFWFEHNQPPGNLNVLIQIYSVSGKLVHQIQRILNTVGNRSSEIEWDGRDAYSEKLGRGVYVYKISVTASNGTRVEKTEKLYLL